MAEIEYIEIDPVSRKILSPAGMLLGVMEDADSERKYFKCPKIVGDDIDLSQFQIYFKYTQATDKDGTKFETKEPGIYHCDDVNDEGDYITFSWKLSGNVFLEKGFIAFSMFASNGDVVRWGTTTAVGTVLLTIPGGLEEVQERYPDIITQLLLRMDAVESLATPEAIQNYVEAYLAEHPAELDETLTDNTKAAPAGMVGEMKEEISSLSEEINNLREQVESGSVGGGSGTSSEVKTILQRIQTEIKACIRDDSVCPNTYIDATDNLINNLGTGSGGEPVDPNPPIEEPDVPTPSNKYRATIIDPVPLTYADRSNYTNFDWGAIDGSGRFAFKEKTFTGTVYIRCFLATRYISGDYLPKIYTNDSETVSYTNLVKLDASEYFGNGTVVTPYGLDADGNITDAPVNGFMYIAKYEIPSGKYGVLLFDANNGNSAFKQGAKGTTAVFYSDITSDVTTMDIEEV